MSVSIEMFGDLIPAGRYYGKSRKQQISKIILSVRSDVSEIHGISAFAEGSWDIHKLEKAFFERPLGSRA
jgi:hypothetical protein